MLIAALIIIVFACLAGALLWRLAIYALPLWCGGAAAWWERRYRDGSLADTSRWTAILTIVVQTPRTPDAIRKNPLGIFVNAINWSKELGS